MIDNLIHFFERFATSLAEVSNSVLVIVTTPVLDLLNDSIIPQWIINLLPNSIETYFGNNSLIDIMFGVMLPVFIGIVFIRFIIGTVTFKGN